MGSTAVYKAFIEAGASDKSAGAAANDVVQMAQLDNFATKNDSAIISAGIENLELETKAAIENLRSENKTDLASVKAAIENLRSETRADISALEVRLLKWMVGSAILCAGLVIAGVGILVQFLLATI